jgi:integrase
VSERPLPIPRAAGAPAQLDRELRSAERYAQSALAPATRRAYESDWLVFAGWCAERGLVAIPAAPAAVAAFLAAEADRGFRPVTVGRRAAAIAAAHRAQDHPNPCDSGAVAQVLSGIRRRHGIAPERRAAPLDLSPLEQVLAELDTSTLAGLRDRALLLLGFAAALRRSELVALDVEHLEFSTARGLLVRIASSKTDQERAGATVAVPYARAGNRSVRGPGAAGVAAGGGDPPRPGVSPDAPRRHRRRRAARRPVGRVDRQAPRQRRRARARAALRALTARRVVTAAAAAGVEERKIANVSRHKDLPVLRRYIRAATAFDDVGEVL